MLAVGYTFGSTLLSSPESPGCSDPVLAEIGGVWEEPFVFPIDPLLLFQRTGFCLESTDRLSNNETTPLNTEYSQCHYQVVESGWGDNYQAGLPCNWVDITDLDTSAGPVTNALQFHSNPDRFLCEGILQKDADGEQLWEETEFVTDAGYPVYRPVCEPFPNVHDNDFGEVEVTVPQVGGMVNSPRSPGRSTTCSASRWPTTIRARWSSTASTIGALITGALALAVEDFPTSRLAIVGVFLCGFFGSSVAERNYLVAQRLLGVARTSSMYAVSPFFGAAVAVMMGASASALWALVGLLMAVGVTLHATDVEPRAAVRSKPVLRPVRTMSWSLEPPEPRSVESS